jgi:hypothetical protein
MREPDRPLMGWHGLCEPMGKGANGGAPWIEANRFPDNGVHPCPLPARSAMDAVLFFELGPTRSRR